MERLMRDPTSRHTTSAAGKLSIGALAKATGVPIETLRTWERRYRFPVAERKPSGHRLYPIATVTRLRCIADALAHGHRAAEVVAATDDELDRLLSATTGLAALRPAPSIPVTGSTDELLGAVASFDAGRLTAALWSDWGRLGAVEFLQTVVAPLIERVGREWAEGRLEIRHEHFLSERLADVLRSLRLPFDLRASGPLVVCATVPGESHALGLQMAALLLASAGLRIVYLGTEVPPVELARVARELGARAVAVSVSAAADGQAARRHLARVREALPRSVVLLLGGTGAPPTRGDTVTVGDFAELDRWARHLHAASAVPQTGRRAR
jgi:DNA-binding transcriptional MerR regulator/methylmalonyl-CoA mutase cobalamin-binding subunit